jgi:hypothetical protein
MMSVRLINLNILFLLFVILIISSLKSSELSIVFFNNLRLILIVITFFLIIISFFKTSVNKKLLRQILLLLFIIVYGISLNFINIKNHDLFINIDSIILILYSFILTFFLLKIVTYYYNDLDNYNHFIFIFFLISTFIFFLLDGYNFKELKYNFDLTSGYQITYNSEKKYGIETPYSINLTRVFFLAVFTAFYLYKEINSYIKPAKNILYLLTSLFFLFFAISGGGKGEVIFGLLILFFMFVSFVKENFIASAVFLSLAVLIINIFFENIVFFERLKLFLSGNYNYGYRLELITLSFNLLYNEPKCLLFGCGFLFFQDYYGFNAGAYPHNLILEFIITYGLLISIYIFTLIFIGLKNIFFLKKKISLIDIFMIYFFLISFKSGSLFTLTTFPMIFYFISGHDFNFNSKFKIQNLKF